MTERVRFGSRLHPLRDWLTYAKRHLRWFQVAFNSLTIARDKLSAPLVYLER
jgi:hypothetical protein